VWYERPLAYYINCVLWSNVFVIWGLWIYWFHDPGATIPNVSVIIGWTSLVGVGYLRSDLIVPLILRTICCAMVGALTLYYRSLGTIPILLRRGNISGRPCMGVIMTYNALAFLCIKTREKYYLAPSTTSDLLFSPLKYQKLLNGPPNYQTIVF
jgi:hypothetical protein